MKHYLELIPKSARVHKRQSRMTRCCILLAVFLVTVIFGMAEMEIRSQRIRAVQDYGNWHIMLKQISEEDAALIAARPDVAAASRYDTLNYRLKDGYSILEKQTVICGFDREFLDQIMTGTKLTEGFYPESETQIILTENAKSLFGLSLGSQVTLDTPSGVAFDYTVSGFADSGSMILKADAVGAFLTPAAFRTVGQSADGEAAPDRDMVFYVQFSPGCNIRSAIADIMAEYQLEDQNVGRNTLLLGTLGQSDDPYMLQLYGVAFGLFLLVLTAGVLMITSSLNSNIAQRTEFFGMMRCIGASRRQIMRFVRLEALRWCRTAIPAGVLSGIGVVWALCALLRYLSPKYFTDLPVFGVSWLSVAFGIIVGILTVLMAAQSPAKRAAQVSPLAAGSGGAVPLQRVRRAANTRWHRIETALGIYHAKMNRKNFILMVGSFALCIILFLSFSTFVDFMYHGIRPLKPYTPELSIVSPDQTCSVGRGLIEKLELNPDVKRVYGRMFAYGLPLRAESYEGSGDLISYEQHQFKWAEKYLLDGSIEEVKENRGAALAVYHPESPVKTGDRITLGGNEVTVSGVLSACPFVSDPGVETLICSEETFLSLTGEQDYTVIDIQLSRGASEKTIGDIRALAGPELTFSDQRSGNDEVRGGFLSLALFIYGFLAIIALITVFNIINSISMSVSARIRQFGAMRAIGMGHSQLLRMIKAEAVTYAASGSAAGCLLGLPVHKLLYEALITSHWGDPWQLPLGMLAVILLLVAAASAAAVYGPAKRIRGLSIVDTISAQ